MNPTFQMLYTTGGRNLAVSNMFCATGDIITIFILAFGILFALVWLCYELR